MYRICFALFSVLVSFSTLAQKSFQKGYFIDNEGARTECYIYDKEWSRNPKMFTYEVDQGEAMSGSVRTIKEIGIGEKRYLRFEVQVDKSSSNGDNLSENFSPEWERDTLFLSVLVDSKADLFYCKQNGEDRFFFRVDDGPVAQLVHKLYRIPGTNTQEPRIATNNTFRNQLKNDVNCRSFSNERFKSLHHDIGVLINFFKQQNECWGDEVTAVDATDHRVLHIKLTPGFSFAHAEGYVAGKKYQDYNPGTGFRLGADFEFSLPFHRKKWTLLLEPAFQSYSSKGQVDKNLTVKYTSLELAMGVRHYFFLSKKASIFINGAAVLDIPTEYLSSYHESSYRMESISICAAAGLGGTFKRFSVEARYHTTRTTDGRVNISSTSFIPMSNDYQKLSVIFGYRLF